jgi:hypothetical protein
LRIPEIQVASPTSRTHLNERPIDAYLAKQGVVR